MSVNNYISRFGENTKTAYETDYGIRYSDEEWSKPNLTTRTNGLLIQTGVSSKVLNTVLNQTSFVSYIVGQVLASNKIKNELGQSLIKAHIGPDCENVQDNIINPLIQFLDRLNRISGYATNSIEEVENAEITWRTRQLGDYMVGDSPIKGSYYWYADAKDGTLIPNTDGKDDTLTSNLHSAGIRCKFLQNAEDEQTYISFGDLNNSNNDDTLYLHQDIELKDVFVQCSDTGTITINGTDNVEIKLDSGITIVSEVSTYINTLNNKLALTRTNVNLGRYCDIKLFSKYNSSGTNIKNYSTQQSVEEILFSIGQRLDAFGF